MDGGVVVIYKAEAFDVGGAECGGSCGEGGRTGGGPAVIPRMRSLTPGDGCTNGGLANKGITEPTLTGQLIINYVYLGARVYVRVTFRG